MVVGQWEEIALGSEGSPSNPREDCDGCSIKGKADYGYVCKGRQRLKTEIEMWLFSIALFVKWFAF